MRLTLVTFVSGLTTLATAIPTELIERGGSSNCISISKWEAKQWIDRHVDVLDRRGNWKSLASSIYTKDFTTYSNSMFSSRDKRVSKTT